MSDYKSPETPPVYGSQPGYPGYDQNAPPQGYPPQGYPPQGYPPQGYPPQGYPPQPGYPPQGYTPHQSFQQGNASMTLVPLAMQENRGMVRPAHCPADLCP